MNRRILMLVPGSRGDVQPYVALGTGLQAAGMPVRVVTTNDHRDLVTSHGLDYRAVEVGAEDILRGERMRAAVEGGSLLLSMMRFAGAMKEAGLQLARRALEACEGADLLIAGLSGVFLARALAEKTGLPLVEAYNVPFTPTRAFPGALAPELGRAAGGALNLASHRLTRQVIWQAWRPVDRIVRTGLLELPPAPRMGQLAVVDGGSPVIYGFSPSVIAPPPDWEPGRIKVTGYWFLDPPDGWKPPEELERFLSAGAPPVYAGFGSMASRDPRQTAGIVLEAVRHAGQRAIVHRGWGGMDAGDVQASVCMIDSVPHAWLFPRLAAVIHHGGAGTTAAGLAAGVPSIVVPFHGDQPFWGRRVASLGVGPAPIPRRHLTAMRLADAIEQAVTDRAMRERAAALGARIRAEDGVGSAVETIRAVLEQGSRR